jgi:hypothetical protein
MVQVKAHKRRLKTRKSVDVKTHQRRHKKVRKDPKIHLDFELGLDGEYTHGDKKLISIGDTPYEWHPDAIFEGGYENELEDIIRNLSPKVKEAEVNVDKLSEKQQEKLKKALENMGIKDIEFYT